MAAIDLGTIRRRLDWAEAHAHRVRDLSAEWTASALHTDTTLDRDRGIRVFRAEVVEEPPEEIALAVGDALHHARAALDNLVGVVRGGATDRSAFRIDTDPAAFDRDERRFVDGVPDWARAAMREVQPFPNNPRRWIGDSLANLHALAIIDRHRALLLSAALIDLDQTGAGTSHPEETRFALLEGGRVLTLEYPAYARVSPTTGVQVIVTEDRLRWTGEGAGWPWYPTASDVAKTAIWATRQVVEAVRVAAFRAGVSVR